LIQERKSHWERVYDTRRYSDVSWYQQRPSKSLQLIEEAGAERDAPVIDSGGGASTLVDHLIDDGYTDISVLDTSVGALAQARTRLGDAADAVDWIVADVTTFEPARTYALWHDRAVLHFLTDAVDRQRYLDTLRAGLPAGGHLVLATFGPDGPEKCSGLRVRRYSMETMAELLGPEFRPEYEDIEMHRTPSGGSQQFLYTRWRRVMP